MLEITGNDIKELNDSDLRSLIGLLCEAVLKWTDLSLKVIANSPDPIIILNILKTKFRPMSWSGSRAEIMQKRLSLIFDLKKHENSLVSEWAYKEEIKFKEEICSERLWEVEHEGRRNECFE